MAWKRSVAAVVAMVAAACSATPSPAWFPGGTALAFVRDVDGNADIYIMNAAGSSVRRLTDDPAEDLDPDWTATVGG